MKHLKRSLLFALLILTISSSLFADRLWTEGFEQNSVTVSAFSAAGSPTISSTTFRSGAYALEIASLSSGVTERVRIDHTTADNVGPSYVRFYFRYATLPSATNAIFYWLSSGGTPGPTISLTTSATLLLLDEDGTIGTSSALSANTWYRVEVEYSCGAACNDLNDIARARIDGVEFAASTTRDFDEPGARFVIFGGNLNAEAQTTGNWFFDDIAVNNSSGTAQTSYPGAGSVVNMQPDSNGDTVGTGSRGGADSGTDCGQVDEVTPNDLTDYYILPDNADILECNLESASNAGITNATITLVQVGARIRAATAAEAIYNARIKSQASGTVSSGTSNTFDSTNWTSNGDDDTSPFHNYRLTSYVDPQAGGAWTTTLLDSAQIGVLISDALPDGWFSALWAVVEYTEAAAAGMIPIYQYYR